MIWFDSLSFPRRKKLWILLEKELSANLIYVFFWTSHRKCSIIINFSQSIQIYEEIHFIMWWSWWFNHLERTFFIELESMQLLTYNKFIQQPWISCMNIMRTENIQLLYNKHSFYSCFVCWFFFPSLVQWDEKNRIECILRFTCHIKTEIAPPHRIKKTRKKNFE